MKSLKMILALVLVLAMTGTTFAAFAITGTTTGVDLGNGLTKYTVSIEGSSKFEDLVITGDVHQINMDYGTFVPTIYPIDLASNAGAVPLDTHLLFEAAEVITGSGAHAETNTNNNPASLVAMSLAPYNFYGMGTFTSTASFAFTDLSIMTAPKAFIQIVLLNDAQVQFAGTYLDEAEVFQAFDVPVGVPEPSTILMLLAGSLCLLAVRSRK